MLPAVSQTWIWSGEIDVAVQNPYAKSRAGSTPLSKIPAHDNKLSLKPSNTFRTYFKNVNGFPTRSAGFNSHKVMKLRHLRLKLDIDAVSLVETQINPSLLHNKDSLYRALFRHQPASSIHNNNSNDLISKRQ